MIRPQERIDPSPERRTLGQCFFIVGAGRSGSTYLYRTLSRHPDVALTNEARVIDGVGLAYEVISQPHGIKSQRGIMGLVNAEVLEDFVPLFLEHAQAAIEEFYLKRFPRFTHWGDKLPDPFFAIEARKIWPDARYVVVLRDPRDVVCSYLSLQEADPRLLGVRAEEFLAQSVEDFARDWTATYQFIQDKLPERHLVRYESLIDEPTATIHGILDYLGLPAAKEVDAAIVSERSPAGHGTSETADQSLGRWRQELRARDVAVVEQTCGSLMDDFGYARSAGAAG